MTADSTRFDDRTAFVTGAGSGIGREAALLFAARGARVVIADLVVEGARKRRTRSERGAARPSSCGRT